MHMGKSNNSKKASYDKEENRVTYMVNRWLELPIDYSQNRFWKEISGSSDNDIRIARETITNVLSQVSRMDWKQVHPEDETYPKSIPYECAELVKALMVAYNNLKKSSPTRNNTDQLIDKMTQVIAAKIANQERESAKEDYFSLVMMQYEPVQKYMLSEYFDEVDKRLRLIHDLLLNQPAWFAAPAEKDVLRRLDDILVDLAWYSEENKESLKIWKDGNKRQADSQKTDFDLVYENLNQVRNKMRKKSKYYQYTDEFCFELSNVDEESSEIIQGIYSGLKDYKRGTRSASAERFEKPYRAYLLKSLQQKNNDVYQRSMNFLKFYYREQDYIAANYDPGEFKKQVYHELCEFVRDLFEGLYEENHTSYTYSFYKAEGSLMAFAKTRLQNAHEQLRVVVHVPMKLLRISHTVIFFLTSQGQRDAEKNIHDLLVDTMVGEKMSGLLDSIKHQRKKLHEEHKDVTLLVQPDDDKAMQKFVKAYNEGYASIIGTEKIDIKTIQRHNCYRPVFQQLIDNTFWLKYECQMVLMREIEKTVEQLENEYSCLNNLFNGKT